MRYIAFVLLISVSLVAQAEPALPAKPVGLFPASELVEQETTESTGHLLVLGALEKVNHELQPENFILVPGRKDASTWYLPEARRTKQVAEYFKSELVESANILFECQGRSCGSSSYWANRILGHAILYGPEQFQHYQIYELHDDGGYVAVYVGQRATRKIYVHVESVSRVPESQPGD